MKTILHAKIINGYRSHTPKGFYALIQGHTGVDLNYDFEALPSPVTGEVVCVIVQKEMGRCIYIKDVRGTVHVFAHMSKVSVALHQQVKRDDILGITGNSGTKCWGAHLHYEIICTKDTVLKNSPFDLIMVRKQLPFRGFNRNPINYLVELYNEFHVPTP